MTKANFTLLDQEVTSRAIDGIHYGNHVRVLVRCGDRLLIWVPGQSAWNGTGQPWRYEPAHLFIHRPSNRYSRLSSGGRLKRALVDQAAAIDAEFGEGVSKLLEPTKTLVLA